MIFTPENVIISYIIRLTMRCKMATNETHSQNIQLYKAAFDKIPKEKRDRILSVAIKEFADNGFENTSIQQIAKKAGISVGSVYKYFENKETLFSH
jgi:AcrR family transcriptional regulator